MQITVVQEMWDNNSICLDVCGKFIYVAQFSANFPLGNDKYLVSFAFLSEIVYRNCNNWHFALLSLFPRGNSEDSICVHVVEKEPFIICPFFLPKKWPLSWESLFNRGYYWALARRIQSRLPFWGFIHERLVTLVKFGCCLSGQHRAQSSV